MNRFLPKDLVINCTDRRFNEILPLYHETARELGAPKYRLQIGSYSCGNYFLSLLQQLEYLWEDLEYDLVIPVLSESQMNRFGEWEKSSVIQCAKQIIVNDFGMMARFYGKKEIRLGRMLFPDYRDHRYPEYEDSPAQTGTDALLAALAELGYTISAAENDAITKQTVLDALNGVAIYYHFPYRQISSAHICEFASIGKAVEQKFIPDDSCAFQCFDVRIRQKEAVNGTRYFKIGRNVFDELDVDWITPERAAYIIYTPRWF